MKSKFTVKAVFLRGLQVHGKEPESWLPHVLKHIGTTKDENLHSLLPEEWKAA